jgi:hypothetical protein
MQLSVDASSIYNVAAVIAGLGVAMLSVRVQQHRGKLPSEPGRHLWPHLADWLLAASSVISITFVIVPLLFTNLEEAGRFVQASCVASCLLFLGYLFTLFRLNPRPSKWESAPADSIRKASFWSRLTEPIPDHVIQGFKRKSKEEITEAVTEVAFAGIISFIALGLLFQEWALLGVGLGAGLLWFAVARFKPFRRR